MGCVWQVISSLRRIVLLRLLREKVGVWAGKEGGGIERGGGGVICVAFCELDRTKIVVVIW